MDRSIHFDRIGSERSLVSMATDSGIELEAQEISSFHELLPALRSLDQLLARAVERVQAAASAGGVVDRFRGLYITDVDVARMLERAPGEGLFTVPGDSIAGGVAADSRLAWLADTFELDSLDTNVVVLALAPEIDLRYERLYSYLHDDVTRRRPTVELALSLFCDLPHARAHARSRFSVDAPLLRRRVIALSSEGSTNSGSLLGQSLQLDEQIINLLLGHDGLDRRLDGCCRLDPEVAAVSDVDGESRRVLCALANQVAVARESLDPLRLHFHGPPGSGRRSAARSIAGLTGAPLLTVNVARLFESAAASEMIAVAVRDAWLRGAVLVLDSWHQFELEDRGAVRDSLERALAEHAITVIAIATSPPAMAHHPMAAHALEFNVPDVEARRAIWLRVLETSGAEVEAPVVSALASQFRLTRHQIGQAAASAGALAWLRAASGEPASGVLAEPTSADWLAGARAQGGEELAALATRVRSTAAWRDLVLPADSLAQLRELCIRVRMRNTVMSEWGFDRRLSRGRGINALFSGPSGTGKTMAAEIIAAELGLDLFRIELAGVVSKYIGETEKNLDRIFDAAERANGILLFDEADALFGKRSEVHDSHDRYANLEISYLLQKMEQFDGVAILATNLRGNLDEAFIRRLAFTVHFPVPDAESRKRIWSSIWPPEAPLETDLDFDFLSYRFALSGGNIKNIALGAAFFAAERGEAIGMRDLMRATVREYQKLGKTLTSTDLGAYAEVAAG